MSAGGRLLLLFGRIGRERPRPIDAAMIDSHHGQMDTTPVSNYPTTQRGDMTRQWWWATGLSEG